MTPDYVIHSHAGALVAMAGCKFKKTQVSLVFGWYVIN